MASSRALLGVNVSGCAGPRLTFDSKEAALDYAKSKGIDAIVTEPKPRRPVIRPGGYGENFATNRRGAWTH